MYNNVRFSTTNPWKFTRHTLTKRHLEIVNKVTIESVTGDVLNISADHTNKTADQTYKTADHTNKTADNTNKSANHTNKTADLTNKLADATIATADDFEEPREHEISETIDEIAVNGFAITKDTPENNLDDDNTEKKQEQAVAKTQSHCDNEKKRCNGTRDENFKTDGTQQASNIVREEKNNNSNNIMTANETPKEIDNDNLNTKYNSNKSEVHLKRKSKVDSTSLGSVPSSQRISSKRSSALAAGKRLQDWTTILGKR